VVDSVVDRLSVAADELGCGEYLERCRTMAAGPSWAERQLTVAEQVGSLPAMVRLMVEQARVTPTKATALDAPSTGHPEPLPHAAVFRSETSIPVL
jgi:hypothetical protein